MKTETPFKYSRVFMYLFVMFTINACQEEKTTPMEVVTSHLTDRTLPYTLPSQDKYIVPLEDVSTPGLVRMARAMNLDVARARELASLTLRHSARKSTMRGSLASLMYQPLSDRAHCPGGWSREEGAGRGLVRARCTSMTLPDTLPEASGLVHLTDDVVTQLSIIMTLEGEDATTRSAELARSLKTYYEGLSLCEAPRIHEDGFDCACQDVMVTLSVSHEDGVWTSYLSYTPLFKEFVTHMNLRQMALTHHPELTTPGMDTSSAIAQDRQNLKGL